jgi:hypothetical protein
MCAVVLKILRCEVPPLPAHFSQEMKSVVSWLLQRDPAARPSARDILRQRFIQVMCRDYVYIHVAVTTFAPYVLNLSLSLLFCFLVFCWHIGPYPPFWGGSASRYRPNVAVGCKTAAASA